MPNFIEYKLKGNSAADLVFLGKYCQKWIDFSNKFLLKDAYAYFGENNYTSNHLKSSAMKKYQLLLSILIIVCLNACISAQSGIIPGESWEEMSPEERALGGWEDDKLREGWSYFRDNSNGTGLCAVVGGKILVSYGDIEELSYVASVRKSVLAMTYGNYVKSGKINLKNTLSDLGMDDNDGLLDIEKGASILDLITARSGIYHKASNPGDNQADAPERGSQKPGSYYLYNNWDFNAAGAAFEKETGLNIFDAVEKDLVKPLQMQDFDRSMHRKSGDLSRSRYPAYHMHFSTRDLARLGLLMLREGKWGDKQIIPSDWAKEIVEVYTPSEDMNPASLKNGEFGYGYMWWVWDGDEVPPALEGAYCARGAWGNYITVIPKLDMVVAFKTKSIYGRRTSWSDYKAILELLIEASKDY